jgi:hypothetical protein
MKLFKDTDWNLVDTEPCRVIEFIPSAQVKDGKVLITAKMQPYASIVLECKKITETVEGSIIHKLDFLHLWLAFKERGIKQDEEVIIFWSKKHYKWWAKIFSAFMPRLWVGIYPKGAFELIADPSSKPNLTGEARARATLPIINWKPEAMN